MKKFCQAYEKSLPMWEAVLNTLNPMDSECNLLQRCTYFVDGA